MIEIPVTSSREGNKINKLKLKKIKRLKEKNKVKLSPFSFTYVIIVEKPHNPFLLFFLTTTTTDKPNNLSIRQKYSE